MSRENGAHFVLFDDQASLEQKAALAKELGVRRGIWVYDQIKDLCEDGFPFGE
jgi:spore germination protein YaaH